MQSRIHQTYSSARYQSGVMTTFTGVMILVMLTLMVFFALRVGVFEQRVSANEMRQKLAFHSAESGIQHAKEFFRNNSALIASSTVDLLPNDDDGWLADTSEKRWQKCSEVTGIDLDTGRGTHPCFGESNPAVRENTYYYSFDDSTAVPVDTNLVLPGETERVTVEALLCVLDVVKDDDVPVKGCVIVPETELDPETAVGIGDGTYFMITLLARGQADCNGDTCGAESLISEQVSSFGAAAGGGSPAVPLVVRSSYKPSGTIEIVPNPNAGGLGVPQSVWLNGNACADQADGIAPFTSKSGSWSTCEMYEWYATNETPKDVACTATQCQCEDNESLTYTDGNDLVGGLDIVLDEEFPCDLFQFYFGVPRSSYEIVKGYSKVIDNCSVLGASSSGIFWVEAGPDTVCNINQAQIGSPDAPVLLILANELTRVSGNLELFGVVFVTNAEDHLNDTPAEIQVGGGGTVYGAMLIEAEFRDVSSGGAGGAFQVVWNENISDKAGSTGGLGAVIGGWSDFHRDWE